MKNLLTAILLFITTLNYAQEASRLNEFIPNAGYETYQDSNGKPVYKRSVVKAYGGSDFDYGLRYQDSVLFNSKGDPLVEFINSSGDIWKNVYTYNDKGLMISDELFTQSGTDWIPFFSTLYYYNSAGLLDEYRTGNGSVVKYYYNNTELIDSIIGSYQNLINHTEYYEYENGKKISRRYYTSSYFEVQKWDENGRLIYTSNGSLSGSAFSSHKYTYDSLGRIIKDTLTQRLHLVFGDIIYVTNYSYKADSLGRAIFKISHNLASDDRHESFGRITYEYTRTGDILSEKYEERADTISEWKPYRKDEYTYNELDQLIKYRMYQYDSRGTCFQSDFGFFAYIPKTDISMRFTNAEYAYTRVDTIIEINDSEELTPAKFSLAQNYPNPFNPETKISFTLPKSDKAILKIYDMLGREVAELLNGEMEKGTHSINFDGRNLSSGVYIYRLQAGSFTESKKMTLIK